MADTQEEVRTLVEELRQQRDQLRLKVHLARADARDEWTELDKKWEHIRAHAEVIGREAGHVAEDVGTALKLVAQELKRGYQRLAKLV